MFNRTITADDCWIICGPLLCLLAAAIVIAALWTVYDECRRPGPYDRHF